MNQDGIPILPCQGCVSLSPPNGGGTGFKCLNARTFQIDYVTGQLMMVSAQTARKNGDSCGPTARLRKEA